MKSAAFGDGEVSVQVRCPQAFGDEAVDALFGMEGPGNTQSRALRQRFLYRCSAQLLENVSSAISEAGST